MSDLTKDEVTRRCQELVYKVAYTFYDSPYIILLRVLVVHNVMTEKKLAEVLNVGPNDVRKYLGMLHVHRLVRRHVNKEKGPVSAWQQRQTAAGQSTPINKTRDVIYWYLDYREFADVVKYRIAMMRRAIDEKIKNEVGKRGYLCTGCGKLYTPLEIAHTFDPRTNAFLCEMCGTELVEDNPALHGDEAGGGGGQDRMQRFNVATAPIRDALKSIEGARLPTINIVAWIAQNVATEVATEAQAAAAGNSRFDVRLGAEEDESEAQRRLAEAQMEQNSLAVWFTDSTVTGQKTALGLQEEAQRAKLDADRLGRTATAKEDEDALLAAHYANLGGDGQGEDDDEDDDLDETEVPTPAAPTEVPTPMAANESGTETPDMPDVMVFIAGVAKRLADVTDADEELMTPEEYEKYFEATSAAV